MSRAFWLEHTSGVRIAVEPGGLLLGRDPRAHVLLRDHDASRAHAWLRVAGNSVQVIALGRRPTLLNGAIVPATQVMKDRDVLAVPGATFTLRVEPGEDDGAPAWAIELDGGLLLGVAHAPLVLGGGADDDVRLSGLPPAAVAFRVAGGALFASLETTGHLEGAEVPAGTVLELAADAPLELATHTLVARTDGPATGSTIGAGEPPPPTSMRLAFQPMGAGLEIGFSRRTVALELPELRARLLATLLAPPSGYRAGDWVPDEVVLAAIWPRDASKTRLEINTLVHRLRKTLVGAGVHPGAVIARSRTGGATRVCLAAGADVVVE